MYEKKTGNRRLETTGESDASRNAILRHFFGVDLPWDAVRRIRITTRDVVRVQRGERLRQPSWRRELRLQLSLFLTIRSDPTLRSIHQCPAQGRNDGERSCDHRGPNGDANTSGDGDPVGADLEGNHGKDEGGDVLRMSGDIQTVKKENTLLRAAATTKTRISASRIFQLPRRATVLVVRNGEGRWN